MDGDRRRQDGGAEGDRGEVGAEPEGEDFGSEPAPARGDQLPEEQPEPVTPDD